MGKILRWILILINLAAAILMIGAFSSCYINPSEFWPTAILGLGFTAFVIINFLFLVYWLIGLKKPLWISLIALIVVLPALNYSIRVFKDETPPSQKESVSLITYNVRLFDVFGWTGRDHVGRDLLNFVNESNTDIVCFQEYMENSSRSLNLSQIKTHIPDHKYSFIGYNYQAFQRKHGLAIFSTYPVLSGEKGHFPGTRNMYIWADIKLPTDTIRVINAHLESIHLSHQQYNLIDSLNVNPTNRQEIGRILGNVKDAFIKRAEQVQILKQEIDRSPYPVVICGDFNDTPVSYTYKAMRESLDDSFLESGNGLGTTYKEFIYPLRIDYILHSKELECTGHEVLDVAFSDHKPVRTNLHFKD
jgi:endonuclease/exonuclease/phosphatase family metal-dependent hydrolase